MLITVEGCVGAGKSTVATGLANLRRSSLLLEAYEQNPFLARFYANPERYATETELAFLLIHYHQFRVVYETSPDEIVSDFALVKDLIYANLNLSHTPARAAFQAVYDLLVCNIKQVDMFVYLAATDELIVRRINNRNRSFEMQVDPAYYARINAAYEAFYHDYPGRKMRIDMSEWDFVANPLLYEKLSAHIDEGFKSK